MTITIHLLTKLMRRTGNNPFASARTRARSLLKQLESHGYQIVEIASEQPTRFTTVADLMADLNDDFSAVNPAPLTQAQRARAIYDTGDYIALLDFKKKTKKSWETLGFVGDDIANIRPADEA